MRIRAVMEILTSEKVGGGGGGGGGSGGGGRTPAIELGFFFVSLF